MTATLNSAATILSIHAAATHGPVPLGRELARTDPTLAADFAPHLHDRLAAWTPEALALTIDTRDEGAYSAELPVGYSLGDLVAEIAGLFTEDCIDYCDPLAFAYQRIADPRPDRTYCRTCDYPVWWGVSEGRMPGLYCELCE